MVEKSREGALERLERECGGAKKYSEELLLSLVRDNEETAFGKTHSFAKISSVSDFKHFVPFSSYDDYADAIARMTKGERNLLTAYPVVLYSMTSGSVGVSKRIPMSDRSFEMNTDFAFMHKEIYERYIREKKGEPFQNEKSIYLSVVSVSAAEDGTPLGGITSHLMLSQKEEILKTLVGPPESMYGNVSMDYTYLKAFYALRERNVSFLLGIFMSSVSDFLSYIEENWKSLCRDIEAGCLDCEKNIPDELAIRLNRELTPDPERAAELRKIFGQGGQRAFVPEIWPKMAYINSIGSGSFAAYTEKVRKYCGSIPISMAVYASSEGMIAVPTEMDSMEYTVIPEAGYFEFIPEEDLHRSPEELQEHTLSLEQLTPGKKYEIVMTNLSGFYRYRIGDVVEVLGYRGESPIICFSYRKNQMLNIAGEKITEDTIQYAVNRITEKTGLRVVEWSVYADLSSVPARYILFIETDGPVNTEQVPALRDILDDSLAEKNWIYAHFLEDGQLSPLQLEILEPQTYQLYRDLQVFNGANRNQLKPVHIIDNPRKEKFFFGLRDKLLQENR